jgi:hypothetical protein
MTVSGGPVTAGYSGKTLAQKLGLKARARLWSLNAPARYRSIIGALPDGAAFADEAVHADILHAFVRDRGELARLAPELTANARAGAAIWISWPKKSSPQFIDLTEDGVRAALLPTGWVDVKVCAVDQDWSALKFLRRRT